MSPRKRSEHSVRDEMQALLDAAVDAIVVIDAKGVILRFSRAAEGIFGYSEKDVLGENVSLLMPEPDRSSHQRYIQTYVETGEAKIIGRGREVMAKRRDGSLFPAELSVGDARIETGERHFVGIIRDVSDRRRDAKELRRQREALAHVDRVQTMGELATGIAHEVNQPLAAIATFAQTSLRLLQSDRLPTERLREVLEDISHEAERAGEIIHRLRRLIRRQSDGLETCNINGIVTEIWRLAEMDAHYRDVPLSLSLAPDLPSVHVERVLIQQVIMNLIRNGVDATVPLPKPRPPVRLTTENDESKRRVVVTVSDSGIGVRDPGRLFESFATTKADGLGLGLRISRSIAESHGGELCYEPEKQGTRFLFAVPYGEDRS